MNPVIFFLIPLFSIWAGDESGYQEYPVFFTNDVEPFCNHHTVTGCVMETHGTQYIIVSHWDSIYHEWLHLMYPQMTEAEIRALERLTT